MRLFTWRISGTVGQHGLIWPHRGLQCRSLPRVRPAAHSGGQTGRHASQCGSNFQLLEPTTATAKCCVRQCCIIPDTLLLSAAVSDTSTLTNQLGLVKVDSHRPLILIPLRTARMAYRPRKREGERVQKQLRWQGETALSYYAQYYIASTYRYCSYSFLVPKVQLHLKSVVRSDVF